MTDYQLSRSTPEAEGISSAAILAFLDEAEARLDHLHSLMLLRHGKVVAEGWWSPYAPQHPHMLYSLSKSFTSTAIGLAVAEGRLTVDDPVLSFFPDQKPFEISANLAAMRVRHLLSMSTGHVTEPQREGPDWARAFLAHPVEREPGTCFVYNTPASYMLSAIVQTVTGEKLVDYLGPRLFAPLGIEGATWEVCPRGVNTGGWGLSIKTEDIARFGQLYLQKGSWQGQQLVPAAWVEQATSFQVSNAGNTNPDWKQGYGYQFWRCRHNAYRGDGAFGQYCLVLPEQDSVLAITGGLRDMQQPLDLVWERLLPAMGAAPLSEDKGAQQRLQDKLASLVMPPTPGAPTSPLARQLSGKRYRFPENEQGLQELSFHFGEPVHCLMRDAEGKKHHFGCGSGEWLLGEGDLPGVQQQKYAASGGWTADDTYTVKLCIYETPYCPTMVCHFTGDEAMYEFKPNVGFGPLERPALVGKLVDLASKSE